MQSDRLIAAIKNQKYLEMFLETELQVAFLQTGNDTWGFAVCFVFRRKKAVEQGIKLRVYTVNDAKVVPMLRNAGVSALMTDFPNEILTEKCQS
jgi:glycerophosphoryl diester phosphodiesterase